MSTPFWFGMGGIGIVILLLLGIYKSRDGQDLFSGMSKTPSQNGQQNGNGSVTQLPGNQPALIPELKIRVNYGSDWVEGFYDAGHKVVITVTDSNGLEIGKATVETEPKDFWNGNPGFHITPENWSPEPPDIKPYYWVHVQADNGAEARVQLGEIGGEVNFSSDSITGTIKAPWINEPVAVECLDWGSGKSPPYSNKDGGPTLTNGTDSYDCSWQGEWDIIPWQDVGVGYFTPDGHWIANGFRDERWMAMWIHDMGPGSWKEGNYSYYFNWTYTFPKANGGGTKDPLVFTIARSLNGGETQLYPGYVLIDVWRSEPQLAWTGSSCEVVPAIHPDQLTRFVWGWVNDYSMSLQEAQSHFKSIKVVVFWEGETSGTETLVMKELVPFTDMVGRWEYRCTLTEHP